MTEARHIVLVEDEDGIRENYCEILQDEGFDVTAFADRISAIEHLAAQLPDLIILDIVLGHEKDGGIRLCREIRRFSKTVPIIFLTSQDSEADRILGIGLDVEDYITKSSSIDYLIVRIQTLFRRINELSTVSEHDSGIFHRGDLTLNPESHVATWKGTTVNLTISQFRMLQELALRPGRIKTASKLMVVANMVVEPNTIVSKVTKSPES